MGREREPEQVLIQPEQRPQGGRSAGIEREDEQDVIPVSGLLDGKGQLALAPALLALQDPAVFGDPLGDPLEGRAQPRFIEVGPENSNNFVSAHPARSLPLDCNRKPSLSAALPGRPCAGPPQPARGLAGQEGLGRVTATAPVFGSVSRSDCTTGERGFIRAEVIAYRDLAAGGSVAAARERGMVRLEGKGYEIQDGDVITFRFAT